MSLGEIANQKNYLNSGLFLFWIAALIFGQVCAPLKISAQSTRQLERQTPQVSKTAEGRTALVIGNAAYQNASQLANPVNDARDMSAALRKVGFEVLSGENLNTEQMKKLILDFGEKLAEKKGVGLFFYAGHGVQIGGRNYLIPVEAKALREKTIEFEAVDVNRVLAEMDAAGSRLNIVVLDACRNNPFERSWRSTDQGLAEIKAPTGTLIAYATAPGKVASDGTGRNGLFTSELLKQLNTPNVLIETVFKRVGERVSEVSKGEQEPYLSLSIRGDFYFVENANGNTSPTNLGTNQNTVKKADAEAIEQEYWETIKNSQTAADFQAYLKEYPNGRFAALARLKISQYEKKPDANLTKTTETSNNTTTSKTNTSTIAPGTVRKNPIGMELVYIPPGEFMMGSTNAEVDDALRNCGKDCKREWFTRETPKHKVTIKEGFWMGKYEVTQGEYTAVMGTNPSTFKNCDRCPVEKVTWNDAKDFVNRLNAKNDGFIYSLPSEAEWEYAARAGTTTAFAFGDSLSSSQANFNGDNPYGGAAKGQNLSKTTAVGSYQPNAWGLFDMHGNVWEWVEDIFNSSYSGLPVDGAANVRVGDSSFRVVRGGSFVFDAFALRSALREREAPAARDVDYGFRVVARLR